MARSRKKIGEYLLRWGVVNEQQIQEALNVQSGTKKRLGQVLVDLGYVSDDDVTKALASQFDLEYIDLNSPEAMRAANFELLPKDIIKKYLVLPLEKTGGRLKLLVHDPMDLQLLDDLRFRLGCEIDIALASRPRIKDYIDRLLSETQSSIDHEIRTMTMDRGLSVDRGMSIDKEATHDQDGQRKKEGSEAKDDDAPIVRLVHKLIAEAVKQRASDIHIEPMADRVRLRYRIDGVCAERDNLPKRMQNSVLTRLKIMAGMKLDERRIPQDGRIKLQIGADRIDFRVSACPAYHGESVVMRILRPDSVRIGLINLGFEQDTLDQFNRAIRRPNGIFLVTGPTGSGKTTTLYSALDTLNRPDKKIITAEDPVEYNFNGINQCQVREDIGLTFPMVLRAMLRQAPNIVLVGEIRDKDVADVAIQAALTGHLVFSTLHTNDAPSAITRLIDMGVKPFLVASSIQAVMGQRLIRILCKECKVPDEEPNQFHLRLIGIKPSDLEGKNVCKPVGCPACNNTGFRGRKGIYEYMTMNSELRDLAFKRAPASQLRAAAVASGMRTLAGDGRLKVLNGMTTAEEVSRSAQVEGLVAADDSTGGDDVAA
jgi:type IV pilus assembly protein PilB